MDFKNIACFLRLCRDQNISAAANNLYMSQQGLSKIIRRMEEELGVTLFKRSHGGVILTPEGILFRERAEHLLETYNGTVQELRQYEQTYVGEVRSVLDLGCLPLLTVRPFLQFMELYPKIGLTFCEHRMENCARLLLSGEADVGFAITPIDEAAFDSIVLLQIQSIVYMPKGHPLTKLSRITLEDFRGFPLAICGSSSYYSIIRECAATGFDPRIVMSTSDISTTLQCVQSGAGISPFFQGINKSFVCPEDVVMRPFYREPAWQLCLILPKEKEIAASTQLFIDHIRRFFKKY